jgi:hypothetical protein
MDSTPALPETHDMPPDDAPFRAWQEALRQCLDSIDAVPRTIVDINSCSE